MMDTLPERLLTARQSSMTHADFLEMVLSDEVARRDSRSAQLRAKAAHLDPSMLAEAWDDSASVTFDHALWQELTTLRFVDNNHNALILDQSEWARRSSRRRSDTLDVGVVTECTSNAPTNCSSA